MFYSSFFLKRLSAVCLAAAIVFVPARLGAGQVQTEPPNAGASQQSGPVDAWEEQQRKAMLKMANEERQREIKKDAERLLELATELKHAVDKSSENTLSLDVVKKAEQIEKLAKEVKERMKGQ